MSGTARTRRRQGIRPRLFVFLFVFTLLILFVLWLFQICLLSYFYAREKFPEMQEIADSLSDYVTDADMDKQVENYALSQNVCINVFRIREGHAVTVAETHVSIHCVIHHLSADLLSRLYDNAKENGGVYDHRMEFNAGAIADAEEDFHLPGIRRNTINAIHAQLVERENEEYLILLDCDLTPVRATVQTLQVQFSWIALAILAAAFVLAFVLSHMIARPLISITAKARELADGRYETDFTTPHSYSEVRELAETLNYAAHELGAADRLQKELIANISHDLRTPLTMIKGYSEIMRDIPGENSPENVQVIIDETTRLSELVSDLMDLSKLQAGTRKPEIAAFDLTAVVRDAMQRYDTLIHHEGYHIGFEADGPAMVLADRTMILQVVYNLINNAVNYTGESRRVKVRLNLLEGRVRLSVKDDGEGIPPDKIKDIWNRYYRVDRVHKRAVMGTGLGLSIVKSALEAHHAVYGVESAVGVGSVFWFELPLAPADTIPAPPRKT